MSTWKMLSSAIFVFVGFLSGASATLTATSEEEFDNIVNTHPHTLVVFSKESGCPECRRYEEFLLENLEEMEESYQCSLTIVRDNAALEKRYGFESTPRIMFFRDGTPAIYHAKDLDVSDLFHWIHAARESRIYTLDDSTFEWSTQASSGATNGDWLVVFTPDKTLAMMAKLEGIGVMAHPLATVVGLVDYTENENLKQRFSIEKDTVLFIEEKGMRRFKGPDLDGKALEDFVNHPDWHAALEQVPRDNTLNDNLREKTLQYWHGNVKPSIERYTGPLQKNKAIFLIGLVVVSGAVFALLKRPSLKKEKSQ